MQRIGGEQDPAHAQRLDQRLHGRDLLGRAAAHVLSAFACEAALILAHQEVRGAPEEIPAAQALIEALGVRGVLFTADALHGQKKPSRARHAPATPFWSGSRPTSRACTMPS